MQEGQTLIKDYQRNRIMAFFDPATYADTEAYQQLNSVIAIGSGQLWGKGLNNTDIASVKNGNFLPESQTDFIFAIIGEELGFIGSAVVILLLILIAMRCVSIARVAKDTAGMVIAAGIGALIGIQGVYEYCSRYHDDAKYRITASVCQLWAEFASQHVCQESALS